MDLLIEKDDKRTYLSRYKVITTSFEESSPSVKRNNTQIQYRNGNVDFGGWHESKKIDYVGYYRADDIDEEETLREKIYALLSDPDGYYITQLKNDSDNSYERPGENTGDYFEKQVNRPSHKRFYVYASSLESELVGSYGGHVLYKISATFTTMKLPYGESVPRNLDIKPNVPYYGINLLSNSRGKFQPNEPKIDNYVIYFDSTIYVTQGQQYTVHADASSGLVWSATHNPTVESNNVVLWLINDTQTVAQIISDANTGNGTTFTWNNPSGTYYLRVNTYNPDNSGYVENVKIEKGTIATPYSPAPSEQEYNAWYTKIYYNTDKLVIPYAGTVPCNQLEQGFTVEFTAKEGGSNLNLNVNGNELTYNGQVYNGDVLKLSGYEYTKNDISIVKSTNKAYFKLLPGISNTISSNLHGSIRILGFQDLYA